MQIMLLSAEYPPQPGGVGDYTRRLGHALLTAQHRVTVLTIRAGRVILYDLSNDEADSACPDDKTVICEFGRDLDWSWRSWPALIAALSHQRPDWLHIQYQTGAYAMHPAINLLPLRLRRRADRPQIAVTFHDLLVPYLFPKAGRLRRQANLILARSVDKLITTNAADSGELRAAGLRPTQIPIGSNIAVTPPPGFERVAWRATLGVQPDELLVAYFGLLAESKGVDLLLDGLAQLARPWRLLLIGGAATAAHDLAYAQRVRRQIERSGFAGRVIGTGHVAPAQVSAHLLSADLAVLPFRDGASLRRGSLLATLAHACPLITSLPNDPETAALIRADQEALLIAPEPNAIAAAIERVAADPALQSRLRAAGMALSERFTWPAIAAAHEACYRMTPRSAIL